MKFTLVGRIYDVHSNSSHNNAGDYICQILRDRNYFVRPSCEFCYPDSELLKPLRIPASLHAHRYIVIVRVDPIDPKSLIDTFLKKEISHFR